MGSTISRRDFLKASSVAGVAAAVVPVSSLASTATKSRVVIVSDASCINSTGTTLDSTKTQAMVDNAVMTLTGKTTKAAAYEALFPAAVTSSTKILLKRNDISGNTTVNAGVVTCLQTGLTSMLNGTFPKANVTIRNTGGDGTSATSAATYIINCPVCCCHETSYGVTLSLKNTMPYLGNPSSKYHSADKKWLHEVSLDAAIKPKQVLSFMDVVTGYNGTGGPTTSRTFTAGKIIISKDLVAVDYQTLRIMEKQASPQTSRIATADAQLKAAQTAGLGTCTVANMEIINIAPPYTTTGIVGDDEQIRKSLKVTVEKYGHGFAFILPAEAVSSAEIRIFDALGHQVWAENGFSNSRIFWNGTTVGGAMVPAGMYFYQIKSAAAGVKGVVMIP